MSFIDISQMNKENTPKKERKFRKRKYVNYAVPDENSSRGSSSHSWYMGSQRNLGSQQVKEENPVKLEVKQEEEEEEVITELKIKRQRNIEERMKLMRKCGVMQAKEELLKALASESDTTPDQKPVRKVVNKVQLPPREKSLRLQGKSPTGELLPKKEPGSTTDTMSLVKRLTGPLPMKSSVNRAHTNELLENFLSSMTCGIKKEENSAPSKSLESFRKELAKLTLPEENVIKVVPNRIFSIAIHPIEDKLVFAVGDKLGNIGLCDFSLGKGKGIQCFHPHIGPVNCISFPSDDLTKMFSTSYDGTTRCGDLNKLMFEEVYASDENMKQNHTTWHTFLDVNRMLIAHGSGDAALIDRRSSNSVSGWYNCHSRSIRTIQRHPLRDDYFMTSSSVGEVNVWDLRNFKKMAPNPVCNLVHPKGLTAAFFSSRGTRIVTTCNDDRLRVFNMSNMEVMRPNVQSYVLHNNHTGRWLTTFKASWHPEREDMFIVGSMQAPRRIAIYSENCQLLHSLQDENLSTVCSVCYFHPSQNIVVGGNCSGRVHVFA